ncbi:MAG: 1-deoxy-D-xylulose-5-phosphate synthase [Candidatus Binatia bacterium]
MTTDADPRYPILDALGAPEDVKDMDAEGLRALAGDLRRFIIDSVTRTGGHLGAGLGVVELTLALFAEYQFNERDKLVWDVGHQCYPHKLITGRRAGFATLRQWQGLSGFPDPAESPYDTVKTGHGGTSISTAMGFALAWRGRAADADRKAVAVIGDGALQEGNAFEALNHGGAYRDLELVVVLNDNNMSISPSVGALSAYLSRVRSSTWLNQRLRTIQGAIRRIPGIGDDVEDVLQRWYHSLQGIIPHHALGIIFEELGFFYYGPIDGHDIDALRTAFRATRWMRRPVLIHAVTCKGRGYKDDVPEATCYHAASGNLTPSATTTAEYPRQGGPTFTAAFAQHAEVMLTRDPRRRPHRRDARRHRPHQGPGAFPERVLDVGMAEQHAVALAAGLALAGHRPIAAIYSTFLQRAYDQLFQEVALQKAPVLFCLDRAGLVGNDGATHNGVHIAYLRCLPNFVLMAPRDARRADGDDGFRRQRRRPHRDSLPARQRRGRRWPTAARAARARPRRTTRRGQRRLPARLRADGLRRSGGAPAGTGGKRSHPRGGQRALRQAARRAPDHRRSGRPAGGVHARGPAVAGGFGSAVSPVRARRSRRQRVEVFALPDQFIDHGRAANSSPPPVSTSTT